MTYEELGKLKAEGKLIQGKQREELLFQLPTVKFAKALLSMCD